jgi:hypothetical protein
MKKTLSLIVFLLILSVSFGQDCFKFKAYYNSVNLYENEKLMYTSKKDVVLSFNYNCQNTLLIKEGEHITYLNQDSNPFESETNDGRKYTAFRFVEVEYNTKYLVQIFDKEDIVRIIVGEDTESVYYNN